MYIVKQKDATVQIRINPHRFVIIKTMQGGTTIEDRSYYPTKGTEIKPDGSAKLVWLPENAVCWVSPKVAEALTQTEGADAAANIVPMASIVGTRPALTPEQLATFLKAAAETPPSGYEAAKKAPKPRRAVD